MPNWTINRVRVNNLNAMKEKIFNKDGELDFDLVIPEPRKKEDCDPKYYVDENSHVELIKEKPWFNWYDWHCDNWGTKWNCSYVKNAETNDTIEFETAWSAPFPIIQKISEMFPDQTIEHEYAYEEDGFEEWYCDTYMKGDIV